MVNLVIQIFLYIYPKCETLFALNNIFNHSCFAKNPLLP